ncbi:MAG: sigma-70 family RNA polymerase sigma factor [Ktedonobacterales bacterium]|nr:sigma-70 family RNA polymerase sigma factor [Ktedonobacterales bacterium]
MERIQPLKPSAGIYGWNGGSALTAQNVDDAELAACIARGDTDALALLYDRYSAAIYSLCLRILHEPAAAEEVAQEVFVRLWRSAASFEPERGRLSTWLLRIAHNLSLNEVRRRQSRPTIAPDADWEIEGAKISDPSVEGDPATVVWMRERATAIHDALAQLPTAQRQAIELAFFGGLSQAEIAAALGDPLGTVKSRIRAGMQHLRELLVSAGVEGLG